jgi:flagellar basal-body rod modification protein FlgD
MSSVNPAASAPDTTPPPPPSNSMAINSNQFLGLLMTQLANQNPLDPTDPTQFTSQLAQFSALEQQVNSNTTLDKISDTMSSLLTQVQLLSSAS